jgi:hypothetical protein
MPHTFLMIELFPIALTTLKLTATYYLLNHALVLTLAFCSILAWVARFQYKSIDITGNAARPGLVKRVHFVPNEIDRMIQEQNRRLAKITDTSSRTNHRKPTLVDPALVPLPSSRVAPSSAVDVPGKHGLFATSIDPPSSADIRVRNGHCTAADIDCMREEQKRRLEKLKRDLLHPSPVSPDTESPNLVSSDLVDPTLVNLPLSPDLVDPALVSLPPSPTSPTTPTSPAPANPGPGKLGLLTISPPSPTFPIPTTVHFSPTEIARTIRRLEFKKPSQISRRHRSGRRVPSGRCTKKPKD